jgi:hypothetical protein
MQSSRPQHHECVVTIIHNDTKTPTAYNVIVWQLGGHGSTEIWPNTGLIAELSPETAVDEKVTISITIHENSDWAPAANADGSSPGFITFARVCSRPRRKNLAKAPAKSTKI